MRARIPSAGHFAIAGSGLGLFGSTLYMQCCKYQIEVKFPNHRDFSRFDHRPKCQWRASGNGTTSYTPSGMSLFVHRDGRVGGHLTAIVQGPPYYPPHKMVGCVKGIVDICMEGN